MAPPPSLIYCNPLHSPLIKQEQTPSTHGRQFHPCSTPQYLPVRQRASQQELNGIPGCSTTRNHSYLMYGHYPIVYLCVYGGNKNTGMTKVTCLWMDGAACTDCSCCVWHSERPCTSFNNNYTFRLTVWRAVRQASVCGKFIATCNRKFF